MKKTKAELAQELARLSCDCSFLLSHLIRPKPDQPGMGAREILKAILDLDHTPPRPLLKANPVGWYGSVGPNIYNLATGEFDGTKNPSAVCFTESTLAGLKGHREIFKAFYGLGFKREWLFKKGANPCLNIREEILKEPVTFHARPTFSYKLFNIIPNQLHPFVNIITESFDATHEREWRFPGNLKFSYQDIWFIYCPEGDFSIFSKIQKNGRPNFIDLNWLDRI